MIGAMALAALLVVIRHSGTADVVPTLAFGAALTAAVAAQFANVLALTTLDMLVLVIGFGISMPVSLGLIMRGPRYLAAPEVVGTFVFGLSGGVAGVRARLDVFGVIVLSAVVGLAGGVIRDLLIGTPPATFRDWRYLAAAGAAGLLAFYAGPLLERAAAAS